jgi:nitrogen regulatory protein PII
MQTKGIEFDLIVSIVEKGRACEVVSASKKAGAEGGTILSGRGSGIHDNKKVFGILIEPEKELILTLVDRTIATQTLQAISVALQLDQPGNGIAFLVKVEETAGICHLCHLQKVIKPEKA